VETAVANGVSALVTIFFICILIFILVWQIGLIALLGVLPSIVLLAVVQYKLHKRARKNISQKDDKSSEVSPFVQTGGIPYKLILLFPFEGNL